MLKLNFILLFIFYSLIEVQCGYPPIGDEVQAGSVLLPASRRGRYLANIVRRQAVDGTGIKFNKDADRMNADAKKKVDVLSDELLPYIIAEQERRTTLYKRVMTAIQNGEKGVTIAEIRNKPPAIIRKGLMYRCPANRAPKEPDGSGVILCDDGVEPSQIMYESCLSAEDKELYVAENKYFFCNRHKIEGPDLPRNGTTVIGCAPCERTTLNYTSAKCALEDTDDVVVHYRYYPDRTYKFVTELDPDREVCEHWNPCQIGYIFSLPSPDQATPASELWPKYVLYDEDFEVDELVPPVPEDARVEHLGDMKKYETTPPKVPVPPNMEFEGIAKHDIDKEKDVMIYNEDSGPIKEYEHMEVNATEVNGDLAIKLRFTELRPKDMTKYYAAFRQHDAQRTGEKTGKLKLVLLVDLQSASIELQPAFIQVLPLTKLNRTRINFTCSDCIVKNVVLRGYDGSVRNLDKNKYKVNKFEDISELVLDLDEVSFLDFGDYFARVMISGVAEENIKVLYLKAPCTDKVLRITRHRSTLQIGQQYDPSINYDCTDCEITDIIHNGESIINSGHITVIAASRTIRMSVPSYQDEDAGVYIVIFLKDGQMYSDIMAIIETQSDELSFEKNYFIARSPPEGAQFERVLKYKCEARSCDIIKVTLNGVPLTTNTRRSNNFPSIAFYTLGEESITFRITSYTSLLMGVVQAVFMIDGEQVTKSLMEIGPVIFEVQDRSVQQTTIGKKQTTTKKSKALMPLKSKSAEATTELAESAPGTTAEATAEQAEGQSTTKTDESTLDQATTIGGNVEETTLGEATTAGEEAPQPETPE